MAMAWANAGLGTARGAASARAHAPALESTDLRDVSAAFTKRCADSPWTGFGFVRGPGDAPAAVTLFVRHEEWERLTLTRSASGYEIACEDGGIYRLESLKGLNRLLTWIWAPN